MAGGDSPAVQLVLQFSTEESCPSVTVKIRRKTKKTEQRGEAFDDRRSRSIFTSEGKREPTILVNNHKKNMLPLGNVAIGPLKSTLRRSPRTGRLDQVFLRGTIKTRLKHRARMAVQACLTNFFKRKW